MEVKRDEFGTESGALLYFHTDHFGKPHPQNSANEEVEGRDYFSFDPGGKPVLQKDLKAKGLL